MSPVILEPLAGKAGTDYAPVFAALGDGTRLSLIRKLSDGRPASITDLTEGRGLTRQAVTKHLRVLEDAGIVRREAKGREMLFALETAPLGAARDYLDAVSQQWDDALERLKSHLGE